MGAILVGLAFAVISATMLLISGYGIGIAVLGYIAGGVLGTLGCAGWAALRMPGHRTERHDRPMVLRLD